MVEEMSRALDGTFYRVTWDYKAMDDQEVATKEEAKTLIHNEARRVHCSHGNQNEGTYVRIRPRMSIVRAVRLLTEARVKGVKLFMRRSDEGKFWYMFDSMGDLLLYLGTSWEDPNFTDEDILARWIVATPEDARRIDARKASK